MSHDQTRYIFETNTIGVENEVLNVDDVLETANHFRCIDMIIDHAKTTLSENFIKDLHLTLKNGTSDSRKEGFVVVDYKKVPNEVGGMNTALSEEVPGRMKGLLKEYNGKKEKTFEDILDFHVRFERIHPFQECEGCDLYKYCSETRCRIINKVANNDYLKPSPLACGVERMKYRICMESM